LLFVCLILSSTFSFSALLVWMYRRIAFVFMFDYPAIALRC